MDINPGEIYKLIVKAGDDWADKEAAASILEEVKKTLLAELMLKGIKNGVSKAASEVEAMATTEYATHITDMVAARREANKAKVNYYATQALADMRRTQAATDRALMKNA